MHVGFFFFLNMKKNCLLEFFFYRQLSFRLLAAISFVSWFTTLTYNCCWLHELLESNLKSKGPSSTVMEIYVTNKVLFSLHKYNS